MVSARENPKDGADADALPDDDEVPDAADDVVAPDGDGETLLPIEGMPLA